MIEILCIVVYIASWFVDVNLLGYSDGSIWFTRMTYIYAHTNILHLGMNLFAFYLFKKVLRIIHMENFINVALVVGVIATFGTEMDLPTIGLSGIIYAMLGTVCARIVNRDLIISLMFVVGINVLVYFYGHSNVLLHALSFIYSYIITKLYVLWKKRKNFCQKKN